MQIEFLIASFIAGILTILAPCILPVLPVILGGTAGGKGWLKPIVITASLATSVIFFTLIIRFSANSFGLSQSTLTHVSGGILIGFGFFTIFPEIWNKVSLKLNLSSKSNTIMGKFAKKGSIGGDALLGASLGPVFSSCSPTYAAILALVLTGGISYAVATTYVVVYALGLALMLLLVAFAGQRIVHKLGWATDPKGWFKRIVGVIFLILGIAIITGADKQFESWLLEQGFYQPIAEFENSIRE